MSQALDTAENILEQLRQGKEAHEVFMNYFENQHRINGKTLNEWRQYFKLQINSQVTLGQLRKSTVDLYNRYQEAYIYYSEAQAMLSAIQQGGEKLFREAHHAQVSKYEDRKVKLPAADTLKREAEYSIGDIKDAEKQAVISRNFWKDIVSSLEGQRKLIEQISIQLTVENKLTDSANRRRDHK